MGVSAYARHRNLSDPAIYYAIKQGRISRRPDGLIDSEKADADWERNTMHSRARPGPKPPRQPKVTAREAADAVEQEIPVPASVAQAATVRIKAGAHSRISRAAAKQAEAQVAQLETPERQVSSLDYSKARAARELYDAKIKKLDYEERLKNLVSRKEVEMEAFNRFRILRDACFNVPNRVASQIAAETDETVVFALLESELRTVFEEFSQGRFG